MGVKVEVRLGVEEAVGIIVAVGGMSGGWAHA
jgi:hypothetical protein